MRTLILLSQLGLHGLQTDNYAFVKCSMSKENSSWHLAWNHKKKQRIESENLRSEYKCAVICQMCVAGVCGSPLVVIAMSQTLCLWKKPLHTWLLGRRRSSCSSQDHDLETSIWYVSKCRKYIGSLPTHKVRCAYTINNLTHESVIL